MKTFNLCLLAVFVLFFGGLLTSAVADIKELGWQFLTFVGVMLGLLLVPASFLIAGPLEKKSLWRRFAPRTVAAAYNGAAALFLVWHGATVNVVKDPVDKVWSFILAVFAALNALTLIMPIYGDAARSPPPER